MADILSHIKVAEVVRLLAGGVSAPNPELSRVRLRSSYTLFPLMSLIQLREVSIGFRGPPLLDNVSCEIQPGQRIGLLGRNGSGKTTLMRMLTGEVEPDGGEITLADDLNARLLPQDIPDDLTGSIADIISAALPAVGEDEQWKHQQALQRTLVRMDLDGDARFESLSSGMKRRVLLGRALVSDPDLLLLDEPTNHLDVDAIAWLEKFLAGFGGTLIFVTHDRMFLRRLADRILELDRGRLFDWSCDYDTFLERKEAALEAEEKQNALFDKKLAQEEVWIRTGIKARRTRNMGRVRALKELREIRAQRRTAPGDVQLSIQQGEKSGRLVAEVADVSFAYDDASIVKEFSTTIMRGDKIGVIGPNGAGKTTLLRLLLGQLPPQRGNVRLGTNLQIAYFDQLRRQLDESRTVQENVGDGYDSVGSGEQRQHIIGYLQNFLFTPERARTPVRYLSGGERNRVLLARLFAKPANVIVLDEPTNDLDTETLEMLESRLVEFAGTILLVSHDREFLNNVVTSTIVFEPEGVREYVGGYDDWQRQRAARMEGSADNPPAKSSKSRPPDKGDTKSDRPRRLKFKEQQELAALPEQIEKLDQTIADLHDQMAAPEFYQQPGEAIAAQQANLKQLERQLADAYARWEELEQLDD